MLHFTAANANDVAIRSAATVSVKHLAPGGGQLRADGDEHGQRAALPGRRARWHGRQRDLDAATVLSIGPGRLRDQQWKLGQPVVQTAVWMTPPFSTRSLPDRGRCLAGDGERGSAYTGLSTISDVERQRADRPGELAVEILRHVVRHGQRWRTPPMPMATANPISTSSPPARTRTRRVPGRVRSRATVPTWNSPTPAARPRWVSWSSRWNGATRWCRVPGAASGVTEVTPPLADDGVLQTVKVLVATDATIHRRFVHLRVTQP